MSHEQIGALICGAICCVAILRKDALMAAVAMFCALMLLA
jgi:hypothetical protein